MTEGTSRKNGGNLAKKARGKASAPGEKPNCLYTFILYTGVCTMRTSDDYVNVFGTAIHRW